MMDYWALYIASRVIMLVMLLWPVWFLYHRTMGVINRKEEGWP